MTRHPLTIYLHLHMGHVLCLRQRHPSLDLKARLLREKVVIARIGGWTQ